MVLPGRGWPCLRCGHWRELTNRADRSCGWGLLADEGQGGSCSWQIERAGGPVASGFSAFGEQIGKVRVGLGAPRRQAKGCSAADVVEDLVDELVAVAAALRERRVDVRAHLSDWWSPSLLPEMASRLLTSFT